MKVCVFGAGAVGGHVAARLSAAHADEVSVVARGARLQAIRERGLTLRSGGEEIRARPASATDEPSKLPPQDLVVVTLKAPSLPVAAESLARLLAPEGCAVFLINGIPWWWRHGLPGASGTLPLLDPEGKLWKRLGPERALGCVVYSPNEMEEPGIIVHIGGNRFVMGEPDGSSSGRLNAAVELFNRGGVVAEATADVRREIWRKLVSNASNNPLSALTGLMLGELGADEELRGLMADIMRETLAVSAALGWDLRSELDPEKIAMRPGRKPDIRSSMSQDVLLKRPLEVEAQLGQIQAFAREAGVAVPAIDVILPLLRGLDRSLRST
jgi:2-dehydropantoate 2-reductase